MKKKRVTINRKYYINFNSKNCKNCKITVNYDHKDKEYIERNIDKMILNCYNILMEHYDHIMRTYEGECAIYNLFQEKITKALKKSKNINHDVNVYWEWPKKKHTIKPLSSKVNDICFYETKGKRINGIKKKNTNKYIYSADGIVYIIIIKLYSNMPSIYFEDIGYQIKDCYNTSVIKFNNDIIKYLLSEYEFIFTKRPKIKIKKFGKGVCDFSSLSFLRCKNKK